MRKPIFNAALFFVFCYGCDSDPEKTDNSAHGNDGGASWLDDGSEQVTTPDGASSETDSDTTSEQSTRDTSPSATNDSKQHEPDSTSVATSSEQDGSPGGGGTTNEGVDDTSSQEAHSSTAPASSSDVSPTTSETSADATSTEELDAPALFNAHCASCHGEDARGKPEQAPEIQHPPSDYAQYVIRNGRSSEEYLTDMPSFDEALVSEQQLNDILSYLSEFPKPATGKALFVDYCANCHGPDAAGGVVNRPILGMTDVFLSTVRQGRNLDRMGTRNMYMPSWKEAELSDSDIAAIGEYVEAIDN